MRASRALQCIMPGPLQWHWQWLWQWQWQWQWLAGRGSWELRAERRGARNHGTSAQHTSRAMSTELKAVSERAAHRHLRAATCVSRACRARWPPPLPPPPPECASCSNRDAASLPSATDTHTVQTVHPKHFEVITSHE